MKRVFRPLTICFIASLFGISDVDGEIIITAIENQSLGVVEFAYAGSANTSALTPTQAVLTFAQIDPSGGFLSFGGAGTAYDGVSTSPSSFGTGLRVSATDAAGDFLSVSMGISLPFGYVSDTHISGTMAYSNPTSAVTFDTLGLAQGTYLWTWGNGPSADQVILTVVPEPLHCHWIAAAMAFLFRPPHKTKH